MGPLSASRISAIRILRKGREVLILPAGRFFPDSPLLLSSGRCIKKEEREEL